MLTVGLLKPELSKHLEHYNKISKIIIPAISDWILSTYMNRTRVTALFFRTKTENVLMAKSTRKRNV